MSFSGGVHYRRMQAADLVLLEKLLPKLLLGNWSRKALNELLESSHFCRVLSTGDLPGSPVLAFAEYQQIVDECHLLNIAVVAEAQGNGLGKKLLQRILMEVRNKHCRSCLLEVRRSNDAAIGLYVSEGFVLTGLREKYYAPEQAGKEKEDALLYTLIF